MAYFQTEALSVGYHGKTLIHDIDFALEKGKILTLIGPNGAGKSTILKSLTRHLQKISGNVYVQGEEVYRWSPRSRATHLAVVLTDRIAPELMTCRELVAMGRYPHTNAIGRLTPRDEEKVNEALALVDALELAERDFTTLSDGQRQRILLARAICQDTEVIVLDEPTAYLDIRYKVEFLEILRRLAREKGVTILLSLHEIDLASKFSDVLMCVKGDTISQIGAPEEVLRGDAANRLYDMQRGSYNPALGSVELSRPEGAPRVFVLGGGGWGIPVYRQLQRRQIPFCTGILFENDVDFAVGGSLAAQVISAPAFEPIPQQTLDCAWERVREIGTLLHSGCPIGSLNSSLAVLLDRAAGAGLPILHSVQDLP
ncbi:MAG: ABC transporter ATP-binding protein [Firmicutes bacterium]|nr:ABC transporter ATP-binding protein [Bacillota bacterium]